jgi:glycosyltransferase involved in cell wall biosynthesis
MIRYPGASPVSRAGTLLRELWRLGTGDVAYVRISMGALALALAIRPLRGYEVAYWHSTWQESLRAKVLNRRDRLFAFLVGRVEHFVTFPATLATFYRDWFGVPADAVRLVPNNVDIGDEEPFPWPHEDGASGNRPRLLFVGRLSERKGGHDLGAIGEEVARRFPGVEIVVAGDGPWRERLEGGPGLTLLGSIENRRVLSLIRQADVVLQPSVSEGCSRVLQESMTLGTPIVFYDIPPSVEVAGHAVADALAVPTADVRALVDRVEAVLAMTTGERASLSATLRRRGDAYTSGAVAESLLVQLGL